MIQDNQSRQRWSVLYAAVIPDTASGPIHAPLPPPPRAQREKFFIGDTVVFTDKHLSERVGIIVRLNAKTVCIAVNDWKAIGASFTLRCGRSSTSNRATPSTRIPLTDTVDRLRAYLLGMKAYFRLAQTPTVWRELDEWLRHRLRAIRLKHWKRCTITYRALRTLGAPPEVARRVANNSCCWWCNSGRLVNTVLTIALFDRLGPPRLS